TPKKNSFSSSLLLSSSSSSSKLRVFAYCVGKRCRSYVVHNIGIFLQHLCVPSDVSEECRVSAVGSDGSFCLCRRHFLRPALRRSLASRVLPQPERHPSTLRIVVR
ncbi:unnamed protein product, partial [Ectocarpus sp. 12 AP-2014]